MRKIYAIYTLGPSGRERLIDTTDCEDTATYLVAQYAAMLGRLWKVRFE